METVKENLEEKITGKEATTPPLDRRVQRTRQLLRDALFQLIAEQGYEAISIQDITERANLGRTTFYLHYQDKEELIKASLRALLLELHAQVEPIPGEICPYHIRCIRIFEHVARRQPLYRALLKETGPVNIGNMLRDYFAELFQRYILERQGALCVTVERSDLVAAHAAGSLFGLISWWLTAEDAPGKNPRPTAAEMGQLYFRLMSQGAGDISQATPN